MGRQGLIASGIMPAGTCSSTDEFQFSPDSDVAVTNTCKLSRIVVLGDRIRTEKLPSFPAPHWIENHPDVVGLPARAEISESFSCHLRLIGFVAAQSGCQSLVVERLYRGAHTTSLIE